MTTELTQEQRDRRAKQAHTAITNALAASWTEWRRTGRRPDFTTAADHAMDGLGDLAAEILTDGTMLKALTIKDGPTFTEELLEFDEQKHTYKYRIIESPLPLDEYVSSITLKAGKGDTTVVTWRGDFKRKNPADNPPEAGSDAGATKRIHDVYRAGLDNLKKQLEAG